MFFIFKMDYFFYFLAFIFGCSIGSFLNVVICRLETGEDIVKKRSHCPKCNKILKWHDLVPAFSFFWLKGKCRFCKSKISWQYPLVELSTGILFLLLAWQYAGLIKLLFLFFLTACLIVIFVYDLKHYLIPDRIVYPAIIVTLLYRLYNNGNWDISGFLWALLAAAASGGFFLLLYSFSKGAWMGFGDVKLAILMGLALGWPDIFAALFFAFFTGAIAGVSMIALGRKKMSSEIPFGPFLAGASILSLISNSAGYLINWIIK